MAKMAKKIQTDYTKGGHDISQTATPLYQTNLQRIDQYNADPTQTIDIYRDKYYSGNTDQSDFLRNYNRAMANKTNANYSATGGGYSSTGQRAYEDAQRYWNDAAARLEDQGVQSAVNMAQNYYNNLLNANAGYNQAYNLGKEYSDIEQYNNLARQNNRFGNQLLGVGGNLTKGVGSVLTMIPATAPIGMGLSAAGGIMSGQTIDPNSALGVGSATGAGAGVTSGMFGTGLDRDAFNVGVDYLNKVMATNPEGVIGKAYKRGTK